MSAVMTNVVSFASMSGAELLWLKEWISDFLQDHQTYGGVIKQAALAAIEAELKPGLVDQMNEYQLWSEWCMLCDDFNTTPDQLMMERNLTDYEMKLVVRMEVFGGWRKVENVYYSTVMEQQLVV